MAGAAYVSRRHLDVLGMVRFLLRAYIHVTVYTAYFLQLFIFRQSAHRTQILLYFFELGFLVKRRVFRLQITDLVQVRVAAALPRLHPYRRFVRVTFHAFLTARYLLVRGRRFVERRRI